MKNTIKFLSGMALFGLMMASANAAISCNGTTQCTGPAPELIESLFPRPEGGILIKSTATINALPCTGASGGVNVLLAASHGNYKETYAALLTASVAGNDVQLRIDTAQAECTLYFARIIN